MSNWLYKKLVPYAIKFREWSKDKFMGSSINGTPTPMDVRIFNPYWCVYPVC